MQRFFGSFVYCPFQMDMAKDLGYDQKKLTQGMPHEKLSIQSDLQEDYARVDVYYQTLNVKKISQSPVISVCLLL